MTLDPVILFVDDTQVVQKGTLSCRPVMATLGSFPEHIRNKPGAWRVVGFLPVLYASKSAKSTAEYHETKARLHTECMSALFAPLVEMFNAGGYYLNILGADCTRGGLCRNIYMLTASSHILGDVHCFLPVVAVFSQDSKEGDFLCNQMSSWMTALPCRYGARLGVRGSYFSIFKMRVGGRVLQLFQEVQNDIAGDGQSLH